MSTTTHPAPKLADIERMATDSQLREAVNTYLMAKAHAQAWRERIEPVQRETLALIGATYSDKRGRKSGPITDPADSWLMPDEQHREWCDELDALYRERKWLDRTDAKGICPALKAEHLERQAARAVLMLAAAHVSALDPDELICAGLEAYRKGLDIVAGLVVNHSSYRRPA